MGNKASSRKIRDVDVEVDSKNVYASIKELTKNSKKKRNPVRRYLKLSAPAVRQDGKRIYWMVIDEEDGTEELAKAEGGVRVLCATSLLKMVKNAILDGPLGALLELPKSES